MEEGNRPARADERTRSAFAGATRSNPSRLCTPRRGTRAVRLFPAPAEEHAPALDLLAGRAGRLSFPTVSVLRVIAADSGPSNKQVGLRAGARDEGQISRVLALPAVHSTPAG